MSSEQHPSEQRRRSSLRDMFRRPSHGAGDGTQPERRGSWRDVFSHNQHADHTEPPTATEPPGGSAGAPQRRTSWKDAFTGERADKAAHPGERRGSWKDVFHKDTTKNADDENTCAAILARAHAMDSVPGAEEATAARADPAIVGGDPNTADPSKVMGGGRHMSH